jgi:hypothetical protein
MTQLKNVGKEDEISFSVGSSDDAEKSRRGFDISLSVPWLALRLPGKV